MPVAVGHLRRVSSRARLVGHTDKGIWRVPEAGTPRGPLAECKVAAQQAARFVTARPRTQISVKKTKSLSSRQKPSNGAIEVYQVEQSASLGNRIGVAKILQINEVDLPICILTAG